MAEADATNLRALLVLAAGTNAVTDACAGLASLGISAIQVSSLADALTVVQGAQTDLIVVEIGEGNRAGVEAISRLRFVSSVPIVAAAGPRDGALVARAVEAGADGYLTALPPEPAELRDRLIALRQGAFQRGPAPVSLARVRDMTVDFDRFEVAMAGVPVNVTPTEFRMLAALVRAAGRVVSARGLMAEAQAGLLPESEAREIVKVHMRRLRAKIEPQQAGVNSYIVSVRGFGYLLERREQPRPNDFISAYAEAEEA